MKVTCKLKRCMAALLTAAMVFTSVDLTALAASGIGNEAAGKWQVRPSDIIAARDFGADSDEAKVISSEAIAQDDFLEATLPKETDNLVFAEGDGFAVTVYAEISTDGNWKPVSAQVKESLNNDVLAEISEADWEFDGEKKYIAKDIELSKAASSYYVEVVYAWSVAVPEELQERFLQTPSQLVAGMKTMQAVDEMYNDLDALDHIFPNIDSAIETGISDAKDKITAAENEVADMFGIEAEGAAVFEQASQKVAEVAQTFADGEKEIQTKRTELADAQKQLDGLAEQWNEQKGNLEAEKENMPSWAYDAALEELYKQKDALDAKQDELNAAKSEFETYETAFAEEKAAFEEKKTEFDKAVNEYNKAIKDIELAESILPELGENLDNAEASVKELLDWIKEYEDASFKTPFPWDNGSLIKETIVDAWDALDALYDKLSANDNFAAVAGGLYSSIINPLESLVLDDPDAMGSMTVLKDDAKWSFLNFDPEFTGEVDQTLDQAVTSLVEKNVKVPDKNSEPFEVAREILTFTVNVWQIFVNMEADVVTGDAVEFEHPVDTVATEKWSLKAPAIYGGVGTTDDEIYTLISQEKEKLLRQDEKWAEAGIPEEFECEEKSDKEIPDILGDNVDKINYTISYAPKMYEVTFVGSNVTKEYPYGTKIFLNNHIDTLNWSYDYTIETDNSKESIYQGNTITVTEDMKISRAVLPIINTYKIYHVLAADEQYALSQAEKDIFNSPALNCEDTVSYRVPSDSAASFYYDEGTQKYYVEAKEAEAGTEGLTWIPKQVKIVGGTSEVVLDLDAEGKMSWGADEYPELKNVEVIYKMQVMQGDSVKEKVLNYLDLPYELQKNIELQKELLVSADPNKWTAKRIYEQFTPNVLNLLKSLPDAKIFLSNSGDAAVDRIMSPSEGWSEDSNTLKVYDYLKKTAELKKEVLTPEGELEEVATPWALGGCVQQGYYEGIKTQAKLLAECLDIIINDSQFNDALASMGYADRLTDVTKLQNSLHNLVDRFENTEMHPALNMESGSFETLVSVIEEAELKDYKIEDLEEKDGILASSNLPKAKPGTYFLKVNVLVENESGYTVVSDTRTMEKNGTISQAELDQIFKELEESVQGFTAVKRYYKTPVIHSDEHFGVEKPFMADATVTMTYDRKTLTVEIEGQQDAEFKYGDVFDVTLPKLPEGGDGTLYYKYYINGEELEVTDEKYRVELHRFNANDKCVITRKTFDKTQEDFEEFIRTLNDNLADMKDSNGNRLAAFVPAKNADGKYNAVVLRMLTTADMDMANMMGALSKAFLGLSYNYIAFDLESDKIGVSEFSVPDPATNVKLNPQAMVNLFLDSGMSGATLLDVMDENGNIKEFVLNGVDKTVIGGENASLGGKISEGYIYLGATKEAAEKNPLALYMTLAPGSGEALKDIRNTFAKVKEKGYLDFAFDGGFNMTGNLPDSVYKLYLSSMVLLGRADLEDLEDRELVTEVEEIKNILKPLFNGEETLTAAVLEKTLANAGHAMDLTAYEAIVNQLLISVKDTLNDEKNGQLVIKEAKDNAGPLYSFTMSYDMAGLLNRFAGEFGDIDVSSLFASTELVIPVSVQLLNYELDFPYEAIVLDVKGEGVTGKLDYVKDLNAALDEAEGPVYAILLKDLKKDITVNGTTVLDLNGKTITGTVAAGNAALRIVSSVLDSENAGGVIGNITGSSVRVATGKYMKNANEILDLGNKVQNGYTQNPETGVVTCGYYTIEDSETAMKVVLDMEQIMAQGDQGNLQTVVLDMLSDVFFNLELSAALKVDGKQIYNIKVDDVLGMLTDAGNRDFKAITDELLESVDKEELKALANALADDLTDRAKIVEVLKNGGELASYTVETAPWEIVPAVKDGAIAIGVGAGALETKTVSLELKPLNAAQKETLKNLYHTLKDMLSVTNRSFDMGELSYADGKLHWSGSATATVTATLSGEEGKPSDYVIALSVILANNADDKADWKEEILLYKKGIWPEPLKARYDEITIGDVLDAFDAADGKDFSELVKAVGLEGQIGDLSNIFQAMLTVGTKLTSAVDRIMGYDNDKIDQAENKVRPYLEKGLNGLYDGETAQKGSVSLTIALELFDDETSLVQDAINKINALDDVFLHEVEDKLPIEKHNAEQTKYEEAQKAYDALNDNAEAQKLVEDNCKFVKFVNAKDYFEESAAELLVEAIKALPEEFLDANYAAFLENRTFADGRTLEAITDALRQAESQYNSLSDELKNYVEEECGIDFARLTNGLDYLDRLAAEEVSEMLAKALADYEAMTADNYEAIKEAVGAAIEAYESLTDEQKAYVDFELKDALYAAHEYLANADEMIAEVRAVISKIDELPDEFLDANFEDNKDKLLDDLEALLNLTAEVNDLYLALSADGKALVEADEVYQKLVNARAYFKDHVGLWVAEVADCDYSGAAQKPEVRVYEGIERLQEKVDYKVSYRNNKNAFELDDYSDANILKKKAPAAVITFKKNYKGTIYKYFSIHKINLNNCNESEYCESVGLEIPKKVYAVAGKAKATTPVIYLNGKKVSSSEFQKLVVVDQYGRELTGTDQMTREGTYAVKVEGKGKNFEGRVLINQAVEDVLMSKVSVTKISSQIYNDGNEIRPSFEVKYKGKVIDTVCYTVTYENNSNIGTATITLTGNGMPDTKTGYSFTGTKIVKFKITGEKLTSKMVNMPKKDRYFTGTAYDENTLIEGVNADYWLINPKTGTNMVKGIDYTVDVQKDTNKGTATVLFTGINNYSGTVKKTFAIKAASILDVNKDAETSYKDIKTNYEKNGAKPADQIKLYFNGELLVEGRDYKITWKNNNKVAGPEAGKKAPSFTIKGKGNFTGSFTETFTIDGADFNDQVTGTAKDVLWKNKANNFKTTVTLTDENGKKLSAGKDYEKVANFTYEYSFDKVEWNSVPENKIVPLGENGFTYVKVTINGTGNYSSENTDAEVIVYRLYETAISKAKISRNTKAVFIYDRKAQDYVDGAQLHLYTDKTMSKELEMYKETIEGNNEATADYKVVSVNNFFVGSAIAEIQGMNGYGGTKKIVFKIKPCTDLSRLDDRLNYQASKNELQFLELDQYDGALYEATPILEF